MPCGKTRKCTSPSAADDLQVVGEAVDVLDEHAGEEVVLRVLVQFDAERRAHVRAAAVGADDDAALRLVPGSVVLVRDAR